MRTITTLEEFLEPDEITWGAVNHDPGVKNVLRSWVVGGVPSPKSLPDEIKV